MLPIPLSLQEKYDKCLQNRRIPDNLRQAYKKWLRYYLDFCGKCNYPPDHKDSLPIFISKLQGKKTD